MNPSIKQLKDAAKKLDVRIKAAWDKVKIQAALARKSLDGEVVQPDSKLGCFGFWESDNNVCAFCDYEKECKGVSLGD
jgi:hypothetical protein